MRRILRGRGPAALLVVLAGAAGTACDELPDGNPLIGPDGGGASASYYAMDPDIDPGDTYYLAEVHQEGSTTIESPAPITDPVTGAVSYQMTVQHEPETQRVEGGYDYQGRIIQVLDQTDAIPDPLLTPVNTTRRTRSVDESVTRYDAHRQPLANELEPVYMTGIGGGPSHEQVTDGLVLDAPRVDALAELSPAAEALAPAAGPRATVRRARPDEIQIANDIPPDAFLPDPGGTGGERPRAEARSVRTYTRRGEKYVLERVELTATRHSANGARVRDRQVSRVRLLRFHENPRMDRARRDLRRGRPVPAEMVPQEYQDDCAILMGGTIGVASTCQTPDDPPPPPADSCPPVASGANVLFQHGFASGGGTWWRMDEWVRCEFQTNEHIRPSLNWVTSIPDQRERLRDHLPVYGNGTVLVGHSNGGLVARSLAQWAQVNAPGRVRGVVTLDTPNRGAIVAMNVQVLEHIAGTLVFGSEWPVLDLVAWHPVWEDDMPSSPFLIRTNGFDETFTRVGIQTHMPKRWSLARIAHSAISECTPESSCGERAAKERVQEVYDRHRHYARFWYRPWQSMPAAASMLLMNGMDATWNAFTAPFGVPSDGFIHGPGQVYPRALRNRTIRNGDSHTGTTRSLHVRDELFAALHNLDLFALPTR